MYNLLAVKNRPYIYSQRGSPVVASGVEDVAAVKDEAAGSAPTPRSTVLIVDSDASSLEFMERALSQAGLRVVATTQGRRFSRRGRAA